MKKITLLMILAISAMFVNAANIVGTISNAIPEGWTYITNDPKYPNPGYYTNGGLKINFEGIGIQSPVFAQENSATVILNIAKLNENQKTGTTDDSFTITGLDDAGVVIATATIKKTEVKAGDNTVTLSGNGFFTTVKVIMTGYPFNGNKYCNVELSAVTITTASGVATTQMDKASMFVNNHKMLVVQNVEEGTMVEIYSATGARVMAEELNNGQIDLSGLNKGVYVVRAGNERSKIVLR